MDDLMNVIRKDPLIQIKINDMLGRHNRLPYNYQTKIGYDTLIQNVVVKELMNLMSVIIVDLDIESNLKIIRTKFLESKNSYNCKYI